MSGKILPGDLLGQTYACFWVDMWLSSGCFYLGKKP